jgi:hypothetical protein
MDGDVVESLRSDLALGSSTSLSQLLKDPGLTVERFMAGLLRSLGPYSQMMDDLLRLLEVAGASTSDNSVAIEFDFGKAKKYSLELDAFRAWRAEMNRVRRLVNERRWSVDDLWSLPASLWRFSGPAEPSEWEREYQRGRWPKAWLQPARTGLSWLDDPLAKVHRVWQEVLAESMALAPTPADLRELRAYDEQIPSPVQLANDDWLALMASIMEELPRYLDRLNRQDRERVARQIATGVERIFERVPRKLGVQDELVSQPFPFLNLPVWKKRDQLYSAWIFTQIAEALDDRGLTYEVKEGKLSFAFAGSHLATTQRGMPIEVHAELRTPLLRRSDVSGRKAIQPDYSIIAASTPDVKGATYAVVEVKQYSAYAGPNFKKAAIDYCAGRPNATVLLACYGPVGQSFTRTLPKRTKPRVIPVAHLRPQNLAERVQFQTALAESLDRHEPQGGIRLQRELRAIRLTWAAPIDLDLHVAVQDSQGSWRRVSYQSRGSASSEPFATLDADRLTGGSETVTVHRQSQAYRVLVHRFSGEGSMAAAAAQIEIVTGARPLTFSPPSGDGPVWHVCDIDVSSGRLIEGGGLGSLDASERLAKGS